MGVQRREGVPGKSPKAQIEAQGSDRGPKGHIWPLGLLWALIRFNICCFSNKQVELKA